ncbi:MAG: DUF3999 family protein [Pirellulaceae bacterium]
MTTVETKKWWRAACRSAGMWVLVAALSATAQENRPDPVEDASPELQARWEFWAEVRAPAGVSPDAATGLLPPIDVLIGPAVFATARPDLADLRLYDAKVRTVPYALRYLTPRQVRELVPGTTFNRTEADGGPHELAIDLQGEETQYNEIEVVTTGEDFRRPVEVEGSDDGETWRRLVTANLLRFGQGEDKYEVQAFAIPPSRFRYVRARVLPDPQGGLELNGEPKGPDTFRVEQLQVWRHVDLPGERMTWPASLRPREPTRVLGTAGSTWILELGGEKNVPCSEVEVDVADAEFVRDVRIAAEMEAGPLHKLQFVELAVEGDSVWQRRPGEPRRPMVLSFPEVQTSRLRLQVMDHRNPPLSIQSARFSFAARQVVFAPAEPAAAPWRLYFGNPLAEPPNYDFARNLPEELVPAPVRGELGEVERNLDFVPPPQPLTERLPWLIYVVLGSVSVVLGGVILSVSRAATAAHDARVQQREPKAGNAAG